MYVVLTSDGVIHETDDVEKFVALLDEYGAECEVLHEPPERWTETNDAMARRLATPNPRATGMVYPR